MQITVLKPQYDYAVNYKLNGKHTVNKYLYEHGYHFKNKDERNKELNRQNKIVLALF